MSETVTNSSISKVAKSFNDLPINATIEGIKTAAFFDRQITKAIEEQRETRESQVNDTPIPTGADIRQAYNEGTYRDIDEGR